jgi:cytochrome c oxidase subunit 2
VRRHRSERGAEPRQIRGGRRTQFRVGALLTVLAAAILVVSLIYTDKARETPTTGPTGLASARSKALRIEATGQQWLWRYDYPNEAFSYYKLVVPVDTTVELDLVSTDVIHTWDVPDLAGKRDAVPGKTNHVVFRADEEGTYDGQSATFSGQAYAAMRTEVDVVSPQEYEDFIARQKADIQAAQDRVVGLIENGEVP